MDVFSVVKKNEASLSDCSCKFVIIGGRKWFLFQTICNSCVVWLQIRILINFPIDNPTFTPTFSQATEAHLIKHECIFAVENRNGLAIYGQNQTLAFPPSCASYIQMKIIMITWSLSSLGLFQWPTNHSCFMLLNKLSQCIYIHKYIFADVHLTLHFPKHTSSVSVTIIKHW